MVRLEGRIKGHNDKNYTRYLSPGRVFLIVEKDGIVVELFGEGNHLLPEYIGREVGHILPFYVDNQDGEFFFDNVPKGDWNYAIGAHVDRYTVDIRDEFGFGTRAKDLIRPEDMEVQVIDSILVPVRDIWYINSMPNPITTDPPTDPKYVIPGVITDPPWDPSMFRPGVIDDPPTDPTKVISGVREVQIDPIKEYLKRRKTSGNS